MEIIYGLLVATHIIVSLLLMIVVLLQPGKGDGGLGAAFGGGAASSVFGGRGAASFLSKTTGVLAALFFVLSIAIAMTGSEKSITDDVREETSASAPASTPAPDSTQAPASKPAGAGGAAK
ncbi:MAG: preprotein translocase subunit SecG [Deltaproteobacteria bacterium]|nr:preprotein translocase subunit SecG [Deltaproteobacteria bacterium]